MHDESRSDKVPEVQRLCGHAHFACNNRTCSLCSSPAGWTTVFSSVTSTKPASTWRRHDVDPQLYLTRLLINLPAVQMGELAAWLLWQTAPVCDHLTSARD